MRIRLFKPDRYEVETDGKKITIECFICDSYEIVEEKKKIEKIELTQVNYFELKGKVNELVDAVNKLKAVYK